MSESNLGRFMSSKTLREWNQRARILTITLPNRFCLTYQRESRYNNGFARATPDKKNFEAEHRNDNPKSSPSISGPGEPMNPRGDADKV